MSERHILNERVTWDEEIQDSICPDYGFGTKLPNTRATGKAPGGQPFGRETQNSGHTFSLSWLNRSFACVQRIRHFYDQYQDGYFTLIDHDGGGRHYVGRFTGDFNRVQAANDSYDVRDLTFEEVPGVPMLQYPCDWQRDSIALYPFNDFGKMLAAAPGNWFPSPVNGRNALLNGGAANDFVAMEYRGYGFQLWMIKGPGNGNVAVSIDGGAETNVDLYASTSLSPQIIFQKVDLPLDLHRVKVRMLGTKNSSAAGAGATFVKLQVMR